MRGSADPVRHHPQRPLAVGRVEGSGQRLPIAMIFRLTITRTRHAFEGQALAVIGPFGGGTSTISLQFCRMAVCH